MQFLEDSSTRRLASHFRYKPLMDVKFGKHGKTQLNVARSCIWHLSCLGGLTSDSLNLLLPREILPQDLAVPEEKQEAASSICIRPKAEYLTA